MIGRPTFAALGSLAVLTRSAAAPAQAWPARPIHIVCGFSVGTTTDLLARLLADRLGERLKIPMVVENRPGAGGNIAAAQVARAPADGHTLMLGSLALTLAPRLFKSVTFKPLEDFEPIGLIGVVPNVVLAGPTTSLGSIAELIDRAKREPGRLRYASSGPGSGSWVAMKLMEARAGISLEEIPYASTAQATTDALGGQVELHAPSLAGGMPLVRGGKLRPLGVASARRSAGAPDIPSIAETIPGYDAALWYGLVGPAGLPKSVVQRLNDELQFVLAEPSVLAPLRAAGVDVEAGSPEAMRLVMADPVRSGIDLMDRIGFRPQ